MKFFERFSPLAHWFLRLAVGSVFLYHGLDKLPKIAQLAEMMQMPGPMIFMLAMMEIVGACLILLGGFMKDWMTRIGALMLIPVMLGAIFIVHWPAWNTLAHTESHPMGGMEFQVTLLMINLFLLIMGNSLNKGMSS